MKANNIWVSKETCGKGMMHALIAVKMSRECMLEGAPWNENHVSFLGCAMRSFFGVLCERAATQSIPNTFQYSLHVRVQNQACRPRMTPRSAQSGRGRILPVISVRLSMRERCWAYDAQSSAELRGRFVNAHVSRGSGSSDSMERSRRISSYSHGAWQSQKSTPMRLGVMDKP